MKMLFLNRTAGHRELILFFNGWSMDENLVRNLKPGRFDVLSLHDYTSTFHLLPELTAPYKKVHLVAWSLGVWAAAEALEYAGVELASALAINGTLRPIDAKYGIAPEIFNGTVANWPEAAARSRFLARVAGGRMELTEVAMNLRLPDDQQQELAALGYRITHKPTPPNPFERAVIGSRDKIFPPATQLAFWATTPTTVAALDTPHYAFRGLSGWNEVLQLGMH